MLICVLHTPRTVDYRPRQQKATTTECLAAKKKCSQLAAISSNPQGCNLTLTTHRHSALSLCASQEGQTESQLICLPNHAQG